MKKITDFSADHEPKFMIAAKGSRSVGEQEEHAH
jgi:hypothetical protein